MCMKYFCSKDCPDMCEFTIERDDDGTPLFIPAERRDGRNGFVCAKLKDFYHRECVEAPEEDPAALRKAAELIRKHEGNILYLRGSGSLAYRMACWDLLFSRVPGTTFVSGNPCDSTGTAAHEYDFGTAANPPASNLENAETIILFGKNAAAASPHFYQYLKELKKKGKRILYIDPIKSETERLADDFIRINPGCDGLLCEAYLLKLEGKEGWEMLVEDAGLSREGFDLFRDYVTSGSTAIIEGCGLQRYSNGMATVRWINRLAVETGNMDLLYYGRSSKRGLAPTGAVKKNSIPLHRLPGNLDDYSLIVLVGVNPAVTYPDSDAWNRILSEKKVICVDTNMTKTAVNADVFVRVGGMFSQADIMTSYFFDIPHARRDRFHDELSDCEAAQAIGRELGYEIDTLDAAHVDTVAAPERRYIEKPLETSWPKNPEPGKFRLLTGSHAAYLNSQVPRRLGENDALVYISPAAADEQGLADGMLVTVAGSCGSFDGIVTFSDKVAERDLFVYKNRKMKKGYPNMAVAAEPTDSGTGYALYDACVTIK